MNPLIPAAVGLGGVLVSLVVVWRILATWRGAVDDSWSRAMFHATEREEELEKKLATAEADRDEAVDVLDEVREHLGGLRLALPGTLDRRVLQLHFARHRRKLEAEIAGLAGAAADRPVDSAVAGGGTGGGSGDRNPVGRVERGPTSP